MPIDNEQQMRDKAAEYYLRGLRVSAQPIDEIDLEKVKSAVELWQKAWELYRKIGDKPKAAEVQGSLIALYKKGYAASRVKQGRARLVLGAFRQWFMFFKIGCLGFGGPMAVFSLLEDELVRNKKILTNKDFLEGAVLGDILPGPVTMDLVTYTGYKLKKWPGAAAATIIFIMPSFLLMLVLAMLYERDSITPEIKDILGCLGAAVVGLILSVGLNLSRKEIKDHREACILIGAFTASLVFELDIALTVGLSGLIGIVVYRDEPDLLSQTLEVDPDDHTA